MKSQFAICLMAISSFFLVAVPVGSGSVITKRPASPVALAIHKLQPIHNQTKVARLARVFETAGRDCNIPWQLLVSIAFHESSLGIHTNNPKTHDYGMMQVNSKTALRYGLSQARLLRDEAYSLAAACKVLSESRERYSKKLPYWLGIYRSGTRLSDPRIRDNAKRYDHMIRLTAATIGYR